jgi:tRNA pseudouridine32 synthase/23S rRNA pseudouridine746 synthase
MFQPGAPVEKTYTAVCEPTSGSPPGHAILDHHIRRSGDEYWRQVVVPDEPPNASSEIELIATAGRLAAYRVRPRTGRKHQIRVQLAAAGLPVLGDPLYGTRRFHDPEDLATRLWLDAHSIRVADFPRLGGAGSLSAAWNSSRDPAALFAQAAAAAASDTPRR